MADKKEDTAVTEEEGSTFLLDLGLSEDEVKARLERYDELEAESKKRTIAAKIEKWEAEKRAPAVVREAERVLLADEGAIVVYLAQDGGRSRGLTASEIVERMVAVSPKVELEDAVTDEDVTEEKPKEDTKEENTAAELSLEVRGRASQLILEGGAKTEKDAIAMAQKELGEVPKDK